MVHRMNGFIHRARHTGQFTNHFVKAGLLGFHKVTTEPHVVPGNIIPKCVCQDENKFVHLWMIFLCWVILVALSYAGQFFETLDKSSMPRLLPLYPHFRQDSDTLRHK